MKSKKYFHSQVIIVFNLLILCLLFSCSPKVPVTIRMSDNSEKMGKARLFPQNFFGYLSRLKYWDNRNIKHIVKPDEIRYFISGDQYYEPLVLKQKPNLGFFPKKILARRIIAGPMNLYIITDATLAINVLTFLSGFMMVSTLDYYYIKKTTDNLAHKIYKTRSAMDFIPAIIIQPFNSRDFIDYFSDAPIIQEKIIDKTYRRQNIYQIVEEYNRLNK